MLTLIFVDLFADLSLIDLYLSNFYLLKEISNLVFLEDLRWTWLMSVKFIYFVKHIFLWIN